MIDILIWEENNKFGNIESFKSNYNVKKIDCIWGYRISLVNPSIAVLWIDP